MAFASVIGFAQDQSTTEKPSLTASVSHRAKPKSAVASLRFDVNRVLIPVSVTDAEDHKVEGLRKEDFRVFEDGVQRQVNGFFVDESPVSVGIVLDASNSMRNKIDHARDAIGAFLRMSLPKDEFFLVSVQDQPELLHAFTTDTDKIVSEIGGIQPRGWTALFDGMFLGIDHLRHSNRDRKVLLVISDGGDNNSRYTESEMKNLVRESDVRIFTLSILERSPSLEKLSEQSGGRAFRVHKLDDLTNQAIALSALVHGEYVLEVTPAAQNRDGKYHSIKVELAQPANGTRLHTSWRHGYYAAMQ